jgi:hypothetical protein
LNQATLIVGAVMVAFIGFVAIKQRLGVYRNIVIGGASAATSGGAGGGGGGGGIIPGGQGGVTPGGQAGGQGSAGNHPTLPYVP